MRTLIEVYQHQADECARETLLKLAAEWTQAISGGLITEEGGFHAAPKTGQRGAALVKCPRRDSAESTGAFHETDALNLAKRRLCDAVGISLGSAAHC